MYTTIGASNDQIEVLLNKHLKPFWGIGKIILKEYSYDSEDKVGFVTLYTITGKKIFYQLWSNDAPRFVDFTGFGSIRYVISYPEQKNMEMFKLLKKYGIAAKDAFWKGAQI